MADAGPGHSRPRPRRRRRSGACGPRIGSGERLDAFDLEAHRIEFDDDVGALVLLAAVERGTIGRQVLITDLAAVSPVAQDDAGARSRASMMPPLPAPDRRRADAVVVKR